jgi:hypothetical protein
MDAEGNFSIMKNKTKYDFRIEIKLHIDDLSALE